tara:strand:+ start:508 stop:921 length:414 start_codon:yes stop_codon:yes gene_type:complete
MNDKDVIRAIKLCGTPMTPKKFWSKAALTAAARKAKADACIHFMTGIPNSKEGWEFIKLMKKYLHKGRYSIRLKGRGSRKIHGNQSYVPLPHAEHYSIYIDQKIKDQNNPQYFYEKKWKQESEIRRIIADLESIVNK